MLHRGLVALFLLLLAGCGPAQKWTDADVGVRPDLVARELSPELAAQAREEDVPLIPPPEHLRPCCAFGSELRVTLMSVPVPGLELANVVALDDLGPHKYDNGALAFDASRPGPSYFNDEGNGLLYTCRGGFIDTAHVRDWADWTLFLGARIGRDLERGTVIELPPEGGRRRVVVEPIPATVIGQHDRRDIAVPLAQWIAFQLSVWHEIATWYGWSALSLFPEEASAFSPEDLYSNLLGIKLAGSLVYQYAVTSEASYNENMSSALRTILARLGAVPADVGQHAARAVDGHWWNSQVSLPDKGLVMRRNLEIGEDVNPWLVSQLAISNGEKEALAQVCGAVEPIPLRNPQRCITGVPYYDYATIEIEVDEALVERGFPLPHPDTRQLTQRDFSFVIARIREQNAAEYGARADQPE